MSGFSYSLNYVSSSISGTVTTTATGSYGVIEQFAPQYENNTDGIAWTHIKPLATSSFAMTNSSSAGYERHSLIKSSAGRLYKLTAFNASTSSLFFQLYNSSSVPCGAGPAVEVLVPGLDTISLDYPFGRYHSVGIAWHSSTSGSYQNQVPSASFWVDANYI